MDTQSEKVILREQKLHAVPAELAGPDCKHLDLTENAVKEFATLGKMTGLKRLILDKNGIVDLKKFPPIPSLETLWLNNNKLHNLGQLSDILKKNVPNLTYLSLMKNPLCPDMYFKDGSLDNAYKRYRLLLIFKLEKLKLLDATPVSSKERKTAQEQGPALDRMQRALGEDDEVSAEVKPRKLSPPKKPAAYLAKGHVRYNGAQSEGNRFILNNEL